MTTHDSGIDQCCMMIVRPVINQQEQSLAREVVHLDQKPGEVDEEHAMSLQLLAHRAFRGIPPNRFTNWAAASSSREDQRSHSAGQGRNREASGTPADIHVGLLRAVSQNQVSRTIP
ncbi:unnamed protein product [Taenia asiatica]|uniref:DUF5726 domain-containing protein n=1 Tax=Taenia asiatica TaxID=60517 RepID=A0A0R3W451_TAEAS|nr:unnamed protein product [Taenia asiatica]